MDERSWSMWIQGIKLVALCLPSLACGMPGLMSTLYFVSIHSILRLYCSWWGDLHMGDTLSCQEAPFQPERHPRSLEQISTITPSKRFKGNVSLGFQRRTLRCFQGSRLSASTAQHAPFTDPHFSHSFGASPGLGQAERWLDSWPVRVEPPRSREAPHNPSITVCRQGVSLWSAWCMKVFKRY